MDCGKNCTLGPDYVCLCCEVKYKSRKYAHDSGLIHNPCSKYVPPGPGLGDCVARVLKFCGVKKWAGCGCNNRINRWNEFGRSVTSRFRRIWNVG